MDGNDGAARGQPGQGAHDSLHRSLPQRGSILDQRGDGQESISFEEGGGTTGHAAADSKIREESEGEESEYSTLNDGESQATAVHRPSLISTILAGDEKSKSSKTPRSLIRGITQGHVQPAESRDEAKEAIAHPVHLADIKDGADEAAAPLVQLAERKDGADEAAAPKATTLHWSTEEENSRFSLFSNPGAQTQLESKESKGLETYPRTHTHEVELSKLIHDHKTPHARTELSHTPTATAPQHEDSISRLGRLVSRPSQEDFLARPTLSSDYHPLSTSLSIPTPITHAHSSVHNTSAIHMSTLMSPPSLEHGNSNKLDDDKNDATDVDDHLARLAETASVDDSDTHSVTSIATDAHSSYVRRGRSYHSPQNRNTSEQRGFYSVPPLTRSRATDSFGGRERNTERIPRKRIPSRRIGSPHGERITEGEQYSSEKKRIAFFKQETRQLVMSDIQKRAFYQKIGHLPDADFCRHVQRLQEMHKRAHPPDGLMIPSLPVPSIATPTPQNSALTHTNTALTALNAPPSHTPIYGDGQARLSPMLGMSDVGQGRSNPVRSVAAQVQSLGQERLNTATPRAPPNHDMILTEVTPSWEEKYEESKTCVPITPATPRVNQEQQDISTRDDANHNPKQSPDIRTRTQRVSNESRTPLDRSKVAYETRSATRKREEQDEKKRTDGPEGIDSREGKRYGPGRRNSAGPEGITSHKRKHTALDDEKVDHTALKRRNRGK